MYHVFLSHGHTNRPWIKELHRFLVKMNLAVFFQEEHIPLGQNFIRAITEAIPKCKMVLLAISPSSLKSKWVKLEIRLTLDSDAVGEPSRLLPVMIEKVNPAKLGLHLRYTNFVDLSTPENRAENFRKLLEVLKLGPIPQSEIDAILSCFESKSPEEYLRIKGYHEVLDWGWDGIRLLDAFIALDYETLEDLTDSHEGSSSQWAPVFMNHPDTWRMLITDSKKIVGYWHFAPLFAEEYALAKKGQLLDSQITADKIPIFELGGRYEVYFVQICMHERFRSLSQIRLLYHSILEVLQELAGQDVFITEVCANAYTEIGEAMCRYFHFNRGCPHMERGTIFTAPIGNILNHSLASKFPKLKDAYRNEGLL